VLLWLHTSSVHASCHNILQLASKIRTKNKTFPYMFRNCRRVLCIGASDTTCYRRYQSRNFIWSPCLYPEHMKDGLVSSPVKAWRWILSYLDGSRMGWLPVSVLKVRLSPSLWLEDGDSQILRRNRLIVSQQLVVITTKTGNKFSYNPCEHLKHVWRCIDISSDKTGPILTSHLFKFFLFRSNDWNYDTVLFLHSDELFCKK
jgi:hypothetical protein